MFHQNKKKLLILGDSYARNESLNPLNSPAWPELLERNGQYQVTNLAEGGSSLWFSFRNFLKYQEEYDKIIFVVTGTLRLYLPYNEGIIAPHQNTGTLNYLLDIKKITTDPLQIENIDAILLYFKYIIDGGERSIYQKLVIKEIREIRPDTILIPVFPDSIFDHQSNCLTDISDRETAWLNLSMHNIFKKCDELRNCHMIDENNQMLYEHVLRWLEGEPVVINRKDFEKMKRQDFDRYLKLKT